MNQSHPKNLVGGVAPAEEHDLARPRMTHGLEQALVALDVVAKAELRRRDAELRRLPAVAQVAGERDLHAAAQAIAVDHRHRRLERALDRMQHAVEQAVVLGDRQALRAVLLELRDVGAGGEGFRARAPKHHAAHLVVGVEAFHRRRDAAPHGAVDRILALGMVEHDPAHCAALFDDKFS